MNVCNAVGNSNSIKPIETSAIDNTFNFNL